LIKRLSILTVIIAIMLAPSLIFAKANHQLTTDEITVFNNTVTVPLVVTNEDNLAAMDIPISFSEGLTLKEVDFKNTRIEHFDLKASVIDNENHTLVLGLIAQISTPNMPDLEAGTGVVANLVFEIDDPSITEVTLETVELKEPEHSLMFVYHEYNESGVPLIYEAFPEFSRTTLSLSGASASHLPQNYALNQNYPNPFNPSTSISFDLPVASHVNLKIYNVLGQEVTDLVNEFMEAGSHSIPWDAARYSSGVYFYRISAENFTETKKMMLLK